MQYIHYIEAAFAALGALGMLCSALSKLPLGKASDVLAHLGTNFIQAAREARRTDPGKTDPPKHIVIPGGDS